MCYSNLRFWKYYSTNKTLLHTNEKEDDIKSEIDLLLYHNYKLSLSVGEGETKVDILLVTLLTFTFTINPY